MSNQLSSFNAANSLTTQSPLSHSFDSTAAYEVGLQPLSQNLTASALTSVEGIDLVVVSFDASDDYLLLGQTDLTFTLANQGQVDSGAFSVDLLYSDDALLGNADDAVVSTVNIDGLQAGGTLTQTVSVQMPVGDLNERSRAENPTNQGTGYVSTSADFLGIQIDPSNAIAESNEANNTVETKGIGLDDVSYFPWDVDGSGLVTPTDAIFAINRLGQKTNDENARADFDGSGLITPTDAIAAINRLGYSINPDVVDPVAPTEPIITSITEISPNRGEEMVTLNREAIIRFSKKIDPSTINSDTVKVIALGQEISGRLVVSSTEKFVTFFPDNPWNPSTEVRIQVDGNNILGRDGVALDADNNGTPGGIITADFRTLPITRIPNTDVFGYVYDSYNRNPDGSNIPLEGVEIRLDALPEVFAVTDENGYFILEDVPAPEFYVYIDGSKVEGLPEGSQYASLGKAFHSEPGRPIQLEMDGDTFDVYLPLMSGGDIVPLSSTDDTQVGFGADAQAFLEREFPDIDPDVWQRTQVTFVAGSAQDDQGNAATQAMIVPVAPERLPAPLPPFVDPSLVISIQAGGDNGFNREADGGATNFDVPAPIEFPNLEGLEPGQKSLIWTFNHDAGDWEVIGTGTVTEDGLSIESDEGVGIRAPGWHFTDPGTPVKGPEEPDDDCDPDVFTMENAIDLFDQVAKCAAGFTGLSGIIAKITQLRTELTGLNSSVRSLISEIDQGEVDAGAIRAGVQTINAFKKTVVELSSEIAKQNPLKKGLAISKCLEGLLDFASSTCDKIREEDSDCDTIIFRTVCRGLEFAKATLGKVNSLISTIERELDEQLTAQLLALACGTLDQIAAGLGFGEINERQSSFSTQDFQPLADDSSIDIDQLKSQLQTVSNQLGDVQSEVDTSQEFLDILGDTTQQVQDLEEDANTLFAGTLGYPSNAFYLIEYGDFQFRGRTDENGQFDTVLPSGTEFSLSIYDPGTGRVASYSGSTGETGTESQVPALRFVSTEGVSNLFERIGEDLTTDITEALTDEELNGLTDADSDGLVDLAERIIGTDKTKKDTDGDGISDLAEIQQGLDPFGGRGFPTGIISNLPLDGEANEIVIQGSPSDTSSQLAYVATGSQGLAIADVSQFNDPILLGQLDLPGDATDVAVDSALQVAAIATNEGGLQLVDIADPMQPALLQTVRANTNQVEIANGIAYIAVGTNLRAIDLQSGQTIETLVLSGRSEITGIAREGTTLYTMSDDKNLRAIDISGFVMAELDSLILEDGGGKVFVSNGIAYAPDVDSFRGGYATANVSDPSNISLISDSDVEAPFIAPQTAIVENGSGTGIFVGSNRVNTLQVLDTSNPEDTNVLRTPIDLPSAPESAAIASGIAFVAGGEGGLQVVNYLSFDSLGNAPTATISSVVSDADPGQGGTQVVEGGSIPISVALTDDVQVRNVELLVNGQVVANDVSAPYDFFATAPTLDSGATSVTIQVRATDTGGNSSLSNELTYNLVPDIVAPVVVGTTPDNGGASFRATNIGIRLNEAIDVSRLNLSGVTLTNLGSNGVLGGGDDSTVALESIFSPGDRRISLQTQNPLVFANYQVTVDSSVIADLAGNTLASPFSFQFTNYELDPDTVVWTSDTNGDWNDASNWNGGFIPDADDDVVIDRIASDVTITVSGTAEAKSLRSEEAFVLEGDEELAGRLEVTGTSTINNRFAVGGAASLSVTGADASFTANGDTALEGGSLFATDGGVITLPSATRFNLVDQFSFDSILRASGVGSLIDLSGINAISGATRPFTYLLVEALEGGEVDLGGVTQITGPSGGSGNRRGIQFTAEGANSQIDLSSLVSFSNQAEAPDSKLSALSGGTILSSSLTSLNGAGINLDSASNLATSQITRLTNGTNTIEGAAVDFSGLTDATGSVFTFNQGSSANLDNLTAINGASFIVNDGVVLSLPGVTSYKVLDIFSADNFFRANGAGSVLELPNLTSLAGSASPFTYLFAEALEGGKVDLKGVTQITGPAGGSGNDRGIQVLADGANSQVDLSALTSFTNQASDPDSKLTAKNGGAVIASGLTRLEGVALELDNTGTLATSQITRYTRGNVTVDGVAADFSGLVDITGNSFMLNNGGTANLNNAETINGASFFVNDGVTLALPSATSFVVTDEFSTDNFFRAQGVGSRLDLSNVTSLTGNATAFTYLLVEALEGGEVDLKGVTEITGPSGGSGNRRGIQILADGFNSEVDLSALTSFTNQASNPDSKLTARNDGTVLASNLATLEGVDVNIESTSNLATSQITSYTRGAATVDGTAADFSGLIDVTDNSFTLQNGGTANLDNVTTIDGASFFVNDGVTLALPSATSFTVTDEFNTDNFFQAQGSGSILDLSNLTSIEGTSTAFAYLFAQALQGGKVDLKGVTEITGPAGGSGNARGIQILSEGFGSEVDVSALTSFTNLASRSDSKLTARNDGNVLTSNLKTLAGVETTSDSSALSLAGLTDYNGDNVAQAINGGLLELLNLATISDGTLTVRADGAGSVVNVDSITGLTEEELNGGRVNLT